ncbi:PRC-barrel domain-containing protein [Variovorax sp. 3P27G3]|uniref:PRC-barrel domain-containing protein n=1 Tax=Variovorax sp. 3P27G3 TaxID=2502214 RepID=UPI001484D0BA|nr:PRC-barrel domain-containing protein [Variovorax sp. 3P27G3]
MTGSGHLVVMGMALAFSLAGTVEAQVAGTRRLGTTQTEAGQAITGWSARQSILGRTVYNASGNKLGKATDLIVGTDKRVTFLLIETGGAFETSRHLVAVSAAQLQVHGSRLVLPEADPQTLALQPAFVHAPVTRTQSAVVEQAQQDVDRARQAIGRLERRSAQSDRDAKASLERQILALRQSQKVVEDKVAEMEAADASKWQAVEAQVGQASARLRSAIRNART